MLLLVMCLTGVALAVVVTTTIGLITSVSSKEWRPFWPLILFGIGCSLIWCLLTSICYFIAKGILSL